MKIINAETDEIVLAKVYRPAMASVVDIPAELDLAASRIIWVPMDDQIDEALRDNIEDNLL